jgi:hypothetical protein
MQFTVDPWDPAYGIANEVDSLEPTAATVNPDVEVSKDKWAPLQPPPGLVSSVIFVDGVRRVDARVWIDEPSGSPRPAICASYAGGAVRCDGEARVGPVILRRGLFTSFGEAEPVLSSAGEFPVRQGAADTVEALSLALQEDMARAEQVATEEACAQSAADLVVVDGPLRGRQHLSHAVGYIKTHHVAYLPAELHRVAGLLQPGQRTPLFLLGTTWSRLSWYIRLPGNPEAPWSGVVRCECSPSVPVAAAASLADLVANTMPRYASEPYKEARAPQNLYPIAGLERELRRRLGDANLIYRALRSAGYVSKRIAAGTDPSMGRGP